MKHRQVVQTGTLETGGRFASTLSLLVSRNRLCRVGNSYSKMGSRDSYVSRQYREKRFRRIRLYLGTTVLAISGTGTHCTNPNATWSFVLTLPSKAYWGSLLGVRSFWAGWAFGWPPWLGSRQPVLNTGVQVETLWEMYRSYS